MCVSDSEYRPLLPYTESTGRILLTSLNPVDTRKWRRKPWSWRAFKVVKVRRLTDEHRRPGSSDPQPSGCRQTPVEVLLLLCVPVVDPDKEDKNWRRPLNCLQLITAPLVCVFAFQSGVCKCINRPP